MMIKQRRRAVAATLLAGATFKVGGQLVDAAVSEQGADVSVGTNKTWLKVCDKESDGHQVHNDVRFVGGGSANNFMTDNNGNNDNCPQTNVLSQPVFDEHRVVEAIPFWPDQFGPWVTGA